MPVATRRELLEAGVHFGHQTRRWNPKMHRYLYGERSGIYIIDLEKTLTGLMEAYDYVRDLGRKGGTVLFVGTKKQAQDIVENEAGRVRMPFVNTRWLGGMLTNFQTISRRLERLRELREMERSGAFDYLPKKEVLKLRHEKEKLERNLGGIQDLERLPDAVFVIDTKKEHIAVTEARKLGLPVIAIVDTNCDPDEVDYIIPGNDDAIRAVSLVSRVIADALEEGQTEGWREFAEPGRDTGPEIEQEASSLPASQVFEPTEPAPRGAVPTGSQVFEPDAPARPSQVFEPDEPDRTAIAEPQPDEISPEPATASTETPESK
jgi:small subunit ribosomal protein S2